MMTCTLQQLSYEEFRKLTDKKENKISGVPEKFTIDPTGQILWWPTIGENLTVHHVTVKFGSRQ